MSSGSPISRLVLLLLVVGVAHAESARFAVVIGVNRSVDPDLPPLHYADDDAARYFDLFRLLGARTYLLARLDENTRRLHPQAAAEAAPPQKAQLDRVVAALAADVARARQQQVPTVVYFIYAGHGNVAGGEGYITLEDARLHGRDLGALFHAAAADRSHAVIDACYSYFLTVGRGPGGRRRAAGSLAPFTALSGVGLLLSTSSARESHEWDAYQAGVFSHEVRSGLYGAADADRDGKVSYREIAAFVERANAAVPNEKFRPDVFALPPPSGEELVDLTTERRLEIGGDEHAHYTIEDDQGVRLADFHNAASLDLRILRPLERSLFVRRLSDEREWEVPATDDTTVSLASLSPVAPRIRPRGAAHAAFGSLFALPFDRAAVEGYVWRRPEAAPRHSRLRLAAGYVSVGVALASLVAAVGLTAQAAVLRDRVAPGADQRTADAANRQIAPYNLASGILYGVGAAAGLSGSLVLGLSPRGASVGVQGSF